MIILKTVFFITTFTSYLRNIQAFILHSPNSCFDRSIINTSRNALSSDLSMSKPKSGDIVCITYDLEPIGDFVPIPLFDDGKVSFVLDGGNYLPALHKVLPALSIGESIEIDDVDAGWGERRDDLIVQVPIASSGIKKEDIKVGMGLYLANGMECIIKDIEEDTFTIDANPPLAGATYKAKITLDDVEEGPSEAKYLYNPKEVIDESKYEIMTIALGCFWGGELEYMRVPGVVGTAVGYTQGQKDNPTYKEVCSGTTGHTEAIQVIFDPDVVSYDRLVSIGLERLGESRNLLNQVENDRGTQYRHGVYYHNDKQKEVAEDVISPYGKRCVTECLETMKFYKAEDHHQQYLLKGGQNAKKNAKETIRCYG
mmetsp:Transcript_15962/g.18186  ORF Transcript_15962/g.18186 Transcript_15962/m.18186 type:complete len:369 (+) Transcript_15962:98-1204(+)